MGTEWLAVARRPIERIHTSLSIGDGRILAVGDTFGGGAFLPAAALYDPSANTWQRSTSESALPDLEGRSYALTREHRVVAVGGQERVTVGGKVRFEAVANSEVYDPKADTWEALPRLPVPRSWPICIRGGDRVFVMAREEPTVNESPAMFSWAHGDSQWTQHPGPSTSKSLSARVLADGSIVTWGREVSAMRWDHHTWSELGTIDVGAAVAVLPRGGFATFGGLDTDEAHARARRWSPDAGWTELPPLPKPRAHAKCIAMSDGRQILFGGYFTDDKLEDMVDGGELDIHERSFPRRWTRGPVQHSDCLIQGNELWLPCSTPDLEELGALHPLPGNRLVVVARDWRVWVPESFADQERSWARFYDMIDGGSPTGLRISDQE